MPYRVSKAQFGEAVEQALSELPPQFAEILERVPVEVVDRPTKQQLTRVGLPPGQLLLGLYIGVNLADRSVLDGVEMPAVIYLFQENLQLVCHSAAQLRKQIRTTVLHEIGHHFGLDEEDLEELGYG